MKNTVKTQTRKVSVASTARGLTAQAGMVPVVGFLNKQRFYQKLEHTLTLLKYYQEGVNRVVEQVTPFRDQNREAVEKVAGQVPEPGRRWLKAYNEMTDSGFERFKSVMEGDVSSFFQFAGSPVCRFSRQSFRVFTG